MNTDKVKEALEANLEALCSLDTNHFGDVIIDGIPHHPVMVELVGKTRAALAELEKPADDDVLQLASMWSLSSINAESLAYDIQQYAESYHAKKEAERALEHGPLCAFCNDPITIGVCENCVPDLFNDDNTSKVEAVR